MKKAKWKMVLALGLGVLAAHKGAAANSLRANQILRDARELIEKGDCEGALKPLNAGLAEKLPPVQLMAAVMFDHGICFKADWDKAVQLYALAHEGGEHAAAFRLAAGAAAPERGPDVGSALWWLAHAKPAVPVQGCELPPDTRDDPERFDAYLNSWPQDKLLRCNYAAGLVATVAGEVHYPSRALSWAVGGDYVVRFTPGLGRIDMKSGKTREFQLMGVFNSHALQERKSTRVTDGFVENLKQVSQRALERYPRPTGIDPDWQFDIMFRFVIE
jgi:hypothetical protein